MSTYTHWQPIYTTHGIPTFPVDEAKKPLIKNYQSIGLQASAKLALRFKDAENFGFLAGQKSNLTVIDVDTTDETVWLEAEELFGSSPLWIRTGSGHLQMWFRNSGEYRLIRPIPDLPIDILGKGQIIAPPSKRGGGYSIIKGDLADIYNLPIANLNSHPMASPEYSPSQIKVSVGNRNSTLLEYLRNQAAHCDTIDDLLDVAFSFVTHHADTYSTGFHEAEITKTVKSVWQWTQNKIRNNEYYVGTGRYLTISFDLHDKLIELGSDALYLYMFLKRKRFNIRFFQIPNDMRNDFASGSWTLPRFRAARSSLVSSGFIVQCSNPSSFKGPALYMWSQPPM